MPNTDEIRELKMVVEHLERTATEMDRQAIRDRYEIQASIDNVEFELKNLNTRLDSHVDIVAQQARIIRNFEDERQRNIGSRGAIRLVWGLLGTGVAAIAYSIHDILSWFNVLSAKH